MCLLISTRKLFSSNLSAKKPNLITISAAHYATPAFAQKGKGNLGAAASFNNGQPSPSHPQGGEQLEKTSNFSFFFPLYFILQSLHFIVTVQLTVSRSLPVSRTQLNYELYDPFSQVRHNSRTSSASTDFGRKTVQVPRFRLLTLPPANNNTIYHLNTCNRIGDKDTSLRTALDTARGSRKGPATRHHSKFYNEWSQCAHVASLSRR